MKTPFKVTRAPSEDYRWWDKAGRKRETEKTGQQTDSHHRSARWGFRQPTKCNSFSSLSILLSNAWTSFATATKSCIWKKRDYKGCSYKELQPKKQLMWVYEGRLAWERSSSTYADGHIIRVQELERGILCFFFVPLGVRGQSQGTVGVRTNTLKMTEKDRDLGCFGFSFGYWLA